MAKKGQELLLTPGDRNRLEDIKALIDQAMKEKKRSGQALALLDAQKQLMGVVSWFIMRDLL